jgi:hypothetical protein
MRVPEEETDIGQHPNRFFVTAIAFIASRGENNDASRPARPLAISAT